MRHVLLALLVLVGITPALGADELAVRQSRYGVKETVDRLIAALDAKGIKPAARVDHAAAGKAAGFEMAPTEVVIFGNPKIGSALMLANPQAAIDLPMRVAAWQDRDGKVWIAYVRPEVLKARHGLTGVDPQLTAMAAALEAFARAAAE